MRTFTVCLLALQSMLPTTIAAGVETCYLPAGHQFVATLNSDIDSRNVKPGEPFQATIPADIGFSRLGPYVIPKQSVLIITVRRPIHAGRLKGTEALELEINTIVLAPSGRPFPIAAKIQAVDARGVKINGHSIQSTRRSWTRWILFAGLLGPGDRLLLPIETQLEIKLLTPIESKCYAGLKPAQQ